ncbi:MAG: HlyC/CorC family transporter [Chloroflexi bacterium]|nr:HlyC/CorC family transporter [Chloroflexota bacterium]
MDSTLALGLLIAAIMLVALGSFARTALAVASKERDSQHLTARESRTIALVRLAAEAERARRFLDTSRVVLIVASALLLVAALALPQARVPWARVAYSSLALVASLLALDAIAAILGRRVPQAGLYAAWWLYQPFRLARPIFKVAAALRRSPSPLEGPAGTPQETPSAPATSSTPSSVELAQPEGEAERAMIRSVLELPRTAVREVMTPRVDIVAADLDTPLEHVVELMMKHGHSRIPVYEGTIDHVVGILYARDLLRLINQPMESAALRDLLREVLFVPETKKVDELLREFQQRRVHVAVVVDEYGGTEGLVTIEDLLEEIVGEMNDFEAPEPEVLRVSENEALLDGRARLDLLKELFAIEVPEEGFDTVAGLVYSRLGRIPSAGDEVATHGLKIKVLATVGRRVKRVRIIRIESGGPEAASA